jgi:putative endonuclease
MEYNLYLLKHSVHNKTYLGITNNLKRRLRQHNCEIKGGAKYTSSFLSDGKWEYHMIIKDLTKSNALSYERIIKNRRRKGKGKTPLEKRMYLINDIIIEHKELSEKLCFKNLI